MADDITLDQLKEAARDRLADAKVLHPTRPHGSVYLTGYTIECWLKAAILKSLGYKTTAKIKDDKQREAFFRHPYDQLLRKFTDALPDSVKVALEELPADVAKWDPQWRYFRQPVSQADSDRFIKAAEQFSDKVRRST